MYQQYDRREFAPLKVWVWVAVAWLILLLVFLFCAEDLRYRIENRSFQSAIEAVEDVEGQRILLLGTSMTRTAIPYFTEYKLADSVNVVWIKLGQVNSVLESYLRNKGFIRLLKTYGPDVVLVEDKMMFWKRRPGTFLSEIRPIYTFSRWRKAMVNQSQDLYPDAFYRETYEAKPEAALRQYYKNRKWRPASDLETFHHRIVSQVGETPVMLYEVPVTATVNQLMLEKGSPEQYEQTLSALGWSYQRTTETYSNTEFFDELHLNTAGQQRFQDELWRIIQTVTEQP